MSSDADEKQLVDLKNENLSTEGASLGVALMYVAGEHAFDVGEFVLDIISLTPLAQMVKTGVNHGLPHFSGALATEALKLGVLGPAVFLGAVINSVLGVAIIYLEMREIYQDFEEEWKVIQKKMDDKETVTFGESFSLYCKGAALLLGGLGLLFGASVIVVAGLGMGGIALGAAAIPLAILCPLVLEVVLGGITLFCLLPKLQQWYQDYQATLNNTGTMDDAGVANAKNQMLASEREAAFGISLFVVHMIAVVSVLLMCSLIAGSVVSGGLLPVVVCGTALLLAVAIKCFQTADRKREYKYTNAMREKLVTGYESIKQTKNAVTEHFQRVSTAASTAWSSFSFFSSQDNNDQSSPMQLPAFSINHH